jgi:hypothetical protein
MKYTKKSTVTFKNVCVVGHDPGKVRQWVRGHDCLGRYLDVNRAAS